MDGTSSRLTPLVIAATRDGSSEASKSAISRIALQPRLMWSQKRSLPTPHGVRSPSPLTTARGAPEWRICALSDLAIGLAIIGPRVRQPVCLQREAARVGRWRRVRGVARRDYLHL